MQLLEFVRPIGQLISYVSKPLRLIAQVDFLQKKWTPAGTDADLDFRLALLFLVWLAYMAPIAFLTGFFYPAGLQAMAKVWETYLVLAACAVVYRAVIVRFR